MLKKILGTLMLLTSLSAIALEETAGKVTYVQASGDQEAFYFRLDTMPEGILYFYATSQLTGTHNGCVHKGSDNIVQKLFSTLLLAKASQVQIKVKYCQTGSYGLISANGAYLGVY